MKRERVQRRVVQSHNMQPAFINIHLHYSKYQTAIQQKKSNALVTAAAVAETLAGKNYFSTISFLQFLI